MNLRSSYRTDICQIVKDTTRQIGIWISAGGNRRFARPREYVLRAAEKVPLSRVAMLPAQVASCSAVNPRKAEPWTGSAGWQRATIADDCNGTETVDEALNHGVSVLCLVDRPSDIPIGGSPGGILEPVTGRSFLFFGTHYKTSDFACLV